MTRTRTRTPAPYSCRNLLAKDRKRTSYHWTKEQLYNASRVHDVGCYSNHQYRTANDLVQQQHHCSFNYYLNQAREGVFINDYYNNHLNVWCLRTIDLLRLVPDLLMLLDILKVAYGRSIPATLQPPTLNARSFDV